MKELSPYQLAGATWLMSEKFRLLGDDMGLGKSAQVVVAADMIAAKKILIICPAVARINWKREFEMWSIFAPDFKICEKLSDTLADQSIVSYEYATLNRVKEIHWDLVICDESHYTKEIESLRTQAIYGKNGIVRNTDRMWCLSGTPAPNHVGELWPLLYTFGATSLSYESFIDRYCDSRPTFYGGQRRNKIVGTKKSAISEIKEILSKVMLRRLKSDVLKDLPPVSFETIYVEGTPLPEIIQMEMGVVKREISLLNDHLFDAQDDDAIAMVLAKLGSAVATLRRYVGLQKVESIAKMVTQEIQDGAYKKIIIFAIHTDVIANLKAHFDSNNIVTVVLNGKTNPKARQEAVDGFQNSDACQIFLGNIQAAGVAITLTAAHQVLFVEQSWVPGDNKQAIDRANRRGQALPVTVRVAALADSIDEKVTNVVKRKTEQLTQIFDEKSE